MKESRDFHIIIKLTSPVFVVLAMLELIVILVLIRG